MCYNCGECSQTCPRQAEPGDFMAAARRYAIASYDPWAWRRCCTHRRLLSVLAMLVLAVLLAGFIYSPHGILPGGSLRLFDFIPVNVIHDLGLGVIGDCVPGRAGGHAQHAAPHRHGPGSQGRPDELAGCLVGSGRRAGLGPAPLPPGLRGGRRQAGLVRAKVVHPRCDYVGFPGLVGRHGLDYTLGLLGLKPTGTCGAHLVPGAFVGHHGRAFPGLRGLRADRQAPAQDG